MNWSTPIKNITIEYLQQYREDIKDSEGPVIYGVAFRIKRVNGKNRRILNKRKRNPRYWILL